MHQDILGKPEDPDRIAYERAQRERKEKTENCNRGYADLPLFDKDSANTEQLKLF